LVKARRRSRGRDPRGCPRDNKKVPCCLYMTWGTEPASANTLLVFSDSKHLLWGKLASGNTVKHLSPRTPQMEDLGHGTDPAML
jgi:hypothetical protein